MTTTKATLFLCRFLIFTILYSNIFAKSNLSLNYSSYFGEKDFNETITKVLYNNNYTYIIGTISPKKDISTYKTMNLIGKKDIFITKLNKEYEEIKTTIIGSDSNDLIINAKIVNEKLAILGATTSSTINSINLSSKKASYIALLDFDLLAQETYIIDTDDYSTLFDITHKDNYYYAIGVISQTLIDDINHIGGHSNGFVVKIDDSSASQIISNTDIKKYSIIGEQRFKNILINDNTIYIIGDGEVDYNKFNNSQTIIMMSLPITDLDNIGTKKLCYIGGSLNDTVNSILYEDNYLYIIGETLSQDFANQTLQDKSRNGYLLKIPKNDINCNNSTIDLANIKTTILATDNNKSDILKEGIIIDDKIYLYGSVAGDYSSKENNILTPLGDVILVSYEKETLKELSLGIFGGNGLDYAGSISKKDTNTIIISANTKSDNIILSRENQTRADDIFISELKPLNADIKVEFVSVLPNPITLESDLTIKVKISNLSNTSNSITPSNLYNIELLVKYAGGIYKKVSILNGKNISCSASKYNNATQCEISKLEPNESNTIEIKLEPKKQGSFNIEAQGMSKSFIAEENKNNNYASYKVKVINSNSSGSDNEGSCFIATASFGSYEHKYVYILRNFRDNYLLTNYYGKLFVKSYYKNSPPLAKWIREHKWSKPIVQLFLAPLIIFAKLLDIFGYYLGVIFMILFFVYRELKDKRLQSELLEIDSITK